MILHREHKAQTRFFDVVGGDFVLEFVRLAGNQLRQRGVRIRHVTGRDQALVVDKDHRLIGGAVGLIFPDRPFRQLALLRRFVLHGVVGGELQARVHRGAPDHVAAHAAGSLFADETVVQLGAVHVVVFDFNARVGFFEALDQRAGSFDVGGGIDDNLALFRGGINHFLILSRITLRQGRQCRSREQYGSGKQRNSERVRHYS